MAEIRTVRPQVITDVLNNPGIGFMTFQRFNGDLLNTGLKWTEGHPIQYQPFRGTLKNPDHPDTKLSYFRIYWRYLEPERGIYRFDMIDEALKLSRERGQTMLLRIAPYGQIEDCDVPQWYREEVGEYTPQASGNWVVDPEDPRYAEYFGTFIRALGARFNGHPDLESVDLSIIGFWGEGGGSAMISQPVRENLMNAYLETFTDTPLVMLLTDAATNKYGIHYRPTGIGYRFDCLGDMFGFGPDWCHMLDWYPRQIIESDLADAWKTGPVSLEICWVLQHWYNMGWDVDYITEQSLKWHISSFNAKSSPVPEPWKGNIDAWLKRMGYRFAPRKVTYPDQAAPGGTLDYTSWWENQGVAPTYRNYPLAFRLRSPKGDSWILKAGHDTRLMLPGDSLLDGTLTLPKDLPEGTLALDMAMLGFNDDAPAIAFAVAGRMDDGWYPLGNIEIRK